MALMTWATLEKEAKESIAMFFEEALLPLDDTVIAECVNSFAIECGKDSDSILDMD